VLTATDLARFLACRHRVVLERAVAEGRRAPPDWADPLAVVLAERGREHERRFVDSLPGTKLDLTGQGVAATRTAIAAGVDVIVQGELADGVWVGRPDVLRRVEGGYQVFDTKLAKETRGASIVQLGLYSALLGVVQGREPARFHVVTPAGTTSYRVADFAAYVRTVQARLVAFADEETYPEPVEHCLVCRFWRECETRRRTDDHLTFVAGISRLQRGELVAAGVETLAALAEMPLPFRPARGSGATYDKIREQARVQLAGRTTATCVHELLPVVAGRGLAALPLPSPGDVFLDLEGDPFARAGGREYLFGRLDAAPRWATTDAEERLAFEATVDDLLLAWERDPGMHVYHYAPYEVAAFKRLSGRHATRAAELDRLLRAGRFVDLHAVVKHALRASVERYSIKDLEPFYGFARTRPLLDARTSLRVVERALETGGEIPESARLAVEAYNHDDCRSAAALRDWLETLRPPHLPRPAVTSGNAPEGVDERGRRAAALRTALGPSLLADLLEWHRREDKAPWWEFFRLRDLSAEELLEEKAAIAGMTWRARVGGKASHPIDRYAYPTQEVEIGEGDTLYGSDGARVGTVAAIDPVARTIDVKKPGDTHPTAVFAHTVVDTKVLAESLLRIGEDVARGGRRFPAARELLAGPRLSERPRESESAGDFAVRLAGESVLAIQGPPGAGKTHTAARMIGALVRAGKRVGVTAMSHKVIRNLLEQLDVPAVHKVSARQPGSRVAEVTDNPSALAAIGEGKVVGGTQWLWARPEAEGAIDVLFVDEAGQLSLANVIAASPAARSLVLLGDPQQLEQPRRGTHPDGADRSALEHILGGHDTVPADRGIFLAETWRLAPAIAAFTSEVFYEGRLRARPELARQALVECGRWDGAGLSLVEVAHESCRQRSVEEAEVVATLVAELRRGAWIDRHGVQRPIGATDILVVAPYNAQVELLSRRLPDVRVGTVDRFQGQEAPVILYSMTSSSAVDAPRGMEFLYSRHRLNVATSRARCRCVIVASPRLFEPECQTPEQMRLANALCRYRELAG
jgi:predicted RecB family nuclease